MIEELRPYPAYKDSGVPWLGEVPEHWEIRRTKTLLRERSEKGFPNEPLLAATQTKGVVRKDQYENRTVLALKDLHLLKLVRFGDFVISLRSFQGGIEYAREQGIISPAYTVLYPAKSDVHGYLAWLFKSKRFVESLSLFVTGIRQGQNIDYERLSRSGLPLPTVEDRAAIVQFLGHVDQRIRRYIRAKQKLIGLLNEQKQAIIHQAITRGLEPNVRLKPSGVEWLGGVPEHWEARKLRSLFRRQGSGTTPADDAFYGGGIPWVMTGDLTDGVVSETKRTVTKQALTDVSALQSYPAGSLAVAMYGATIGKTGVFEMQACTNQACCVFAEPLATVNVRFVQTAIIIAKPQLIRQSYGGGQPNINSEIVCSLRIPVPTRDEQERIMCAIADSTASLHAATQRASDEVSLLREWRIRLIADVVTGKLDVREAAAHLPQDVKGAEPAEDTEAGNDEEEEGVGVVARAEEAEA